MGTPNTSLVNISTGFPEVQRTPDTFKVASAASGISTVWTPAAGKRFRLMGGIISVSSEVASATQDNSILILDNATTFIRFAIFIPAAAPTLTAAGLSTIPFALPGNGYLSAVVGNALKTSMSAALTAGLFNISVWGCEE